MKLGLVVGSEWPRGAGLGLEQVGAAVAVGFEDEQRSVVEVVGREALERVGGGAAEQELFAAVLGQHGECGAAAVEAERHQRLRVGFGLGRFAGDELEGRGGEEA